MSEKVRFFENPILLIPLFLLLTASLYFAFDFNGEARDVIVTDRYATIAFGDKDGVTIYELRKQLDEKKAANPQLKKDRKIRLNVNRFPKLLQLDPVRKGSFAEAGIAEGLSRIGVQIFLSDPLRGLSILEASQVDQIKEIGFIPLAGAEDVTARGNVAYVSAGEAGLYLLDISLPRKIKPFYHLDTPGKVQGVFIFDAYERIKTYEITAEGTEVVTEKDRPTLWIFIADGTGGVRILEDHPDKGFQELKNIAIPGNAHSIFIQDFILYVAAGKAGLCMINVFAINGTAQCLPTPGDAWDVTVSNGKVYVADGTAGLQIYQAAPGLPVVKHLSSLDVIGEATSLAISHELAYLGSGGWGLAVIDVANPMKPILRRVIEAPGEADPALLWVSLFNPLYRTNRVAQTWNTLTVKFFLIILLCIFSLALLTQFVLPIRDDQRLQVMQHGLLFMFRRLERVIYIENGQVFRRDNQEETDRAMIVYLDRFSAALVIDPNERVRTIGPGVSFLKPDEKLARSIDLRVQSMIFGPGFDDDPFADQLDSESTRDFELRKKRCDETHAWTADHVEISATIVIDFRVRGIPIQGSQMYRFDPVQAYRAMAGEAQKYEQVLPVVEPASDWQLKIGAEVIRCWQRQIERFSFGQLFQELDGASPLMDGESRFTLWQRILQYIEEEVTCPKTSALDDHGNLTGEPVDSAAFQKIRMTGAQVLSVRIVHVRLRPAYEDRLATEWSNTWLPKALQEKVRIDAFESGKLQGERKYAQWGFVQALIRPLRGRIHGYGRMVDQRLQASEAANLLLDGTLDLKGDDPTIPDHINQIRGKI